MRSAECLAMARKFQDLGVTIAELHGPVSDCESLISSNVFTMESTVLSGRPLDDGKLSEGGDQIGSVHSNLNMMEAECTEKYKYWMDAYVAAKAREEEEASKAAENNK